MALDKPGSVRDETGGQREAGRVNFNRTSTYNAIRHQSGSRLLLAIHRHPDHAQLREPDTCYTYLHLVVAIGDAQSEVAMVPMIYQLSNAGVDVDAKDCKDRTALELAIVKGLRVLMVALLRVGTDQATTDYLAIISNLRSPGREVLMDEFERYTPDLWTAAIRGDLGSVYVLINSWCRVKVRRRGRTLLEHLRGSGRESQAEMVTLLSSYEMTIEFVHATLAGDEESMLDILMDESACDVDILDISYVDPQLGSLRPMSLRDTAIALNHPGRILQLLSPKCKRNDPSTGIPDLDLLLNTESPEPDAAANQAPGADYILPRASHVTASSHHPRFQKQSSVVDLHPSLSLSGIEPRISGEEEEDDADSDSNLLLFNTTYRSFKDDDDEDTDLPKVIDIPKVIEKVRGNEGVKDVRASRTIKGDVAAISNSDRGKRQNRDNNFKVNDGVRDNSRTYGDTTKNDQYVRVENEKSKELMASKRGSGDGESNMGSSRKWEGDQYMKLNGSKDVLDYHQQRTNRCQRKNGRKGIKSSLCIVS